MFNSIKNGLLEIITWEAFEYYLNLKFNYALS